MRAAEVRIGVAPHLLRAMPMKSCTPVAVAPEGKGCEGASTAPSRYRSAPRRDAVGRGQVRVLEAPGGWWVRVRAAHSGLLGVHAQTQLATVEAEERFLISRPDNRERGVSRASLRARQRKIAPDDLVTKRGRTSKQMNLEIDRSTF